MIDNSPVNVTLLVPQQEEKLWQNLVEKFEQQNPQIHLNILFGSNNSNELAEVYLNDFQKDNPEYDLVYTDIIWTAQFAENRWLKDLSDLQPQLTDKEKLKQNFLKNDIEAGFYQDKLYRFPFRSDVSLIYYRQDLLNKLKEKPPTSFDDLIRIAQILKEKNWVEKGYLWQGAEYEGLIATFVEILRGFGGDWQDDNIEQLLNKSSTKKTIDFLGSLISTHQVSPTSVLWDIKMDTEDKFKNGRAAFVRNWAVGWDIFNDETSKVHGLVGVIPIPTVGDSQYSWSCQGGWGLGIANKTKYPEEAWKVIEFLTSITSQRLLALNGYIPTRKILFDDPLLLKKYHHYPIIKQSLENTVLRSSIPNYLETSQILQKQIHQELLESIKEK